LFFVTIKTIAKALVKEENLLRALFKLGKVIKTFLGLRTKTGGVE